MKHQRTLFDALGPQHADTRSTPFGDPEADRLERESEARRVRRSLEAQRRKREGMQRAETNAGAWIERARACARRIARLNGTVWCDLVREAMGDDQPASYRAWGALFRTGFEPTGERVTSEQPQGKGNEQRVWRLREGE